MSAGNNGQQLIGGQPEPDIDLMAGSSETIKAAVGDFFGDKDSRHGER